MRLGFGTTSVEFLQRCFAAIGDEQHARLAAISAVQADAAVAAAEAEIAGVALDFSRAAAAEEARRIRALRHRLARLEIPWRQYRQRVLEAEAWSDAVAELAESTAARLVGRLRATAAGGAENSNAGKSAAAALEGLRPYRPDQER